MAAGDQRSDTLMQDRSPLSQRRLLQRTAGPYKGVIQVPVTTLDDILVEGGAPQPLDFLSVDVEGHEIEVLRGFNFARWQPRLILLEDHTTELTETTLNVCISPASS